MVIKEKMQKAMNEQIKAELDSAYIYLSMAAYFETMNLEGFAHWMRLQSEEEVEHAMKFFDHINERGGQVALKPVDGPPIEFESPLQIFQMAYEHEKKVTRLIHDLYKLALDESDYAANSMLQWFVDEQVEEEDSALQIVEQLEMIGDSKTGLLMLDRELAKRT
jgi:ferritin